MNTVTKRSAEWGPLGRGSIDGGQIKEIRSFDVLFKDGSARPTFFQPNGRGSLWLRRDRECPEAMQPKLLMAKMQNLCVMASKLLERQTALTKEHTVWAERTQHGVLVYRKTHDENYGSVIGRKYEPDFRPTKAQLEMGRFYRHYEDRFCQCSAAWQSYSYLLQQAARQGGLLKSPHNIGGVSTLILKDPGLDFMVVYQWQATKAGGYGTAVSPSWPFSGVRYAEVT